MPGLWVSSLGREVGHQLGRSVDLLHVHEGTEEVFELVHPGVEEVSISVAKGFLFGKSRQCSELPLREVQIVLDHRLESAHARISIADVEGNAPRTDDLYEVLSVISSELMLDELYSELLGLLNHY